MSYVAMKPIKTATRTIPPGGAIEDSEAESWPNLAAMLKVGHVRIDRGEEYIVLRPFKIAGGRVAEAGEVLKDARAWPNIGLLAASGYVRVATEAEARGDKSVPTVDLGPAEAQPKGKRRPG